MIPFSKDVFLGVVEHYAAMLWPAQIVAFLLGCAIVDMIRRPRVNSDRLVCGLLAAGWFWIGSIYYGEHIAGLSWAAWISAAAFTVQGVLLLVLGTVRNSISLRYERNAMANCGLGFMLFALFGYPAIAAANGIPLTAAPVFGFAPDPTILLTFGALLIAKGRMSLILFVIPLGCAAANGVSAWLIGLPADYIMLPAAIGALALMVKKTRSS